MSAFDDMERGDIEPAGHLVSRADYLNASARPEAGRVRALIDRLLDEYPPTNRDEMVRRLRQRDDRLHRSASFELLLHGLLLTRGFTVLEIEPQMPGGRSPDFLAAAPDGREFYLEATVAGGEAGTDPGADRRLREVLQALDDVQSPDFFLHLHHRGVPTQPIRLRRLREEVQHFVDGLNYEACVADLDAGLPLPIHRFEEHGLTITVKVIPKNLRRAGGRAVGGRMLPGGIIHPERAIKAAVEGKAGRYGEMDRPYIVAVNALDIFANEDSAVDALFGTDVVRIRENGGVEWQRNRDGVWMGLGGPTYTRVSAVLSTERLSAWDAGQRRLRLIHNPWATRQILDLPLGVDIQQVTNDRLQKTTGQSLGEIFGLPGSWPEVGD